MEKTIAAIDIGSNAIRMMIARPSLNNEPPEQLEYVRLPIRLGQDAFTQGHIGDALLSAVTEAFTHFRRVADTFGVTDLRAVATSALRESDNAGTLIDRVARASNINIELISGEEEARLVHLAVAHSLPLNSKRALLIDIGGGSVEVTVSEGDDIISAESYPLGTVRLLRKLAETGDALDPRLLKEFTQAVRGRIDRELKDNQIDICVGTGGNIEEMGSLAKRLYKTDSERAISAANLHRLIDELARLSPQQRAEKFNLRTDRADVILPAAMVLHTIIKQANGKTVEIPNVGLKDGVLLDLAQSRSAPSMPRNKLVINSARRLGEKFSYDSEHAQAVEKLSLKIFNQTLSLHCLNEKDRVILSVAALLHDVGHFINTIDHDKHGYYILSNVPLLGFTQDEQHLAAVITRVHRRGKTQINDEVFKALSLEDRQRVLKCVAILRLADAIETGRSGKLDDIEMVEIAIGEFDLNLYGQGDFVLEVWSLNKRKSLFEEVFGVKLNARPIGG